MLSSQWTAAQITRINLQHITFFSPSNSHSLGFLTSAVFFLELLSARPVTKVNVGNCIGVVVHQSWQLIPFLLLNGTTYWKIVTFNSTKTITNILTLPMEIVWRPSHLENPSYLRSKPSFREEISSCWDLEFPESEWRRIALKNTKKTTSRFYQFSQKMVKQRHIQTYKFTCFHIARDYSFCSINIFYSQNPFPSAICGQINHLGM